LQPSTFDARRLNMQQSVVVIDGKRSVGSLKTTSASRIESLPEVAVIA